MGLTNEASNGNRCSSHQTSTTQSTLTTVTATNEATAAPTTPHGGIITALPPTTSTVHTTEFTSLSFVCPVMSMIGPQTPVPAFTSSATDRMINAVTPAANAVPKTLRMASG